MNAVAGVAFAALIGAWLWQWSSYVAVQRERHQQGATDDQEKADDAVNLGCPKTDGESLAECVAKAVAASREQRRGQRDLKAQEDMAFWAMSMFIASIGGILVTGLGIFYVRETLLMAKAVVSIENRPWIGVETFIKGDIKYSSDDVWECTLSIRLDNFGNCPATYARISYKGFDPFNTTVLPRFIENEMKKSEAKARIDHFGSTIFPRGWIEDEIIVKLKLSDRFEFMPQNRPFASHLVIVVATYMSAQDASIHHTWCVLKIAGAESGDPLRFDPQRGHIPHDEIGGFRLPIHHGAT